MVPALNPFISTSRDIKSVAIIVLFVLAPMFMFSVLSYFIVDFISGLGLIQLFSPAGSNFGVEYVAYLKSMIGKLDILMLLIVSILIARLTIQSFRTDMHPIYGVVGLLSLPLIITVAGFGSNVIGFFTGLEFIQGAANQFSYTYTFFQNAPAITGWIAVFILFVMIGSGVILRKKRGGGL